MATLTKASLRHDSAGRWKRRTFEVTVTGSDITDEVNTGLSSVRSAFAENKDVENQGYVMKNKNAAGTLAGWLRISYTGAASTAIVTVTGY